MVRSTSNALQLAKHNHRWKAQRRTLVELWLDHLWVVAKGALEDVGTAVGGDVCGMGGDGDGDHCRPKG